MAKKQVSCNQAQAELAFKTGYADYRYGPQSQYVMMKRRGAPQVFYGTKLLTDVERAIAESYINGFMRAESDSHD